MVYFEFINDPNKEKKRLIGFEKVHLTPKQSKKVFITTEATSFYKTNEHGDSYLIPDTYTVLMTNGNDIEIRNTMKLIGSAPHLVKKFPRKTEWW